MARSIPSRPGFFRRHRLSGLAAEVLQILVIGLAELLAGDFHLAHLRQETRVEAPEYIGDSPDREADSQQANQDFCDPALGGVA